MVNLHITSGELAEILTEKPADNLRNSHGSPGGMGIKGTSPLVNHLVNYAID